MQQGLARWSVRRPEVNCDTVCAGEGPVPAIDCDSTLFQAFENLLNNAADSGSNRVEVRLDWNGAEVRIAVRDWGRGIRPELLEDIGKPVLQSGRNGLGIGLLISHATVERHDGRIELCNAVDGGAIATLFLPRSEHIRD